MEKEFTKGKWSKDKTLFSGLRMTSGNHPDEAEAQANTIMALAAPDMYAALKDAVEEVEYLLRWANNNGGSFDSETCEYGRSALSRARGETK